jgi:cyclopropane fatty-acyl-phospholipid synthase-like methyltransferase
MSAIETLGWRLTGLRNRLSDRAWERRLNIRTQGSVEVNAPDANRYATFAYGSVFRVLDALELQPDDVYIDIGSGKGRVVCCAAQRRAARIIGIDIDPSLCAIAKRNATALKGAKTSIEIVNLGAQAFDYRDCTAFQLFNSFGPATVKQMLDAIAHSLRENPRPIRFAYVNPFHEDLFRACGFLEEHGRLHRTPWSGLKFDVSFWRTPRRDA